MIIELKYNHSTDTALDQIKQRNYPAKVLEYLESSTSDAGNRSLLLVGINYDKDTKTHTCKIEEYHG